VRENEMTNTRVTLASRPNGMIKPTDFKIVQEDLPELKDGEVLVKQVYMSLDPAMRGWLDEDEGSYMPPVRIGETMRSFGIGIVEASNNPAFTVGTRVNGMFGWSEHYITTGEDLVPLPEDVPLEHFMGLLGLPGATAYHGFMELIDTPKAGEIVLISGAAGSVGSLVGQIAKAEGLKVIGVTGSDEKKDWLLNELGFDAVINYKTENLEEMVAKYAPDGIDRHFENVGGKVLEVALDNMKIGGKITLCGLISTYNDTEPSVGPHLVRAIARRLTLKGLVIIDQQHRFGEIFEKLSAYAQKGQIKYRLDIVEGLKQAPEAINKLFDGTNQGKLVIRI